MNKYLTYLIAIISGIIGVFAFAPFNYWALSYVSLFGLIWVVKTPQKSTALLSAFLWGLSFFTFGVNWLHVSIHQFGGAPLAVSYFLVVLLAAYLSLYPLLFAYLVRRLQVQRAVLFPVLWTFTEFLRGWIFTGFPWLQFGYTQMDSPFVGIAPIFGVTGLTFFVMFISVVVFNGVSALLNPPRKVNVAVANALILAVIGSVAAYTSQINYVKENPEKALNVTLVQGNIEQNLKWDPNYLYQTMENYGRLIGANLGKTDLIILPEAAFPIYENDIQPFFQSLQSLAEKAGTEVMIGTIYQDEGVGKLLNSIVVLGDKSAPYHMQTANRYSKHHLVPFGEYVPLESILRPLGSVFNLPMSAFQSGEAVQQPLKAKKLNFTAAICYEIILGAQLQQNLTTNSDFIVTVSNDAWFGNSIGPWQHLQMAQMRALEFGKPVIRATNTGVTAFIDAQGKIVAQAPQFVETTLSHNIAPTTGKTPYSVFGDVPLYVLSAVFFLLHFVGMWLQRVMLRKVRKD
ncbi:apolipoprotein N-acyltransferase [Aggregatibacter kilianii]|uniref:apolipoprotein N-acyltransferase n=1 Tax=Aggregatibacter kilianii TaxID=2025884 RepID=UPI000D655525|nr:apolipoprotein N-acyltransferase [Aggregatibacter kilianii]